MYLWQSLRFIVSTCLYLGTLTFTILYFFPFPGISALKSFFPLGGNGGRERENILISGLVLKFFSQEGKANRDDSVCTENLGEGRLAEGKLEKKKKKSLSEFFYHFSYSQSEILSLIPKIPNHKWRRWFYSALSLVALKSMATGSGKVWGAKLSPKVQRKRVKSKVALLKVEETDF